MIVLYVYVCVCVYQTRLISIKCPKDFCIYVDERYQSVVYFVMSSANFGIRNAYLIK